MRHVDLHIHSIYSDGTDTIEQIIKKAKAKHIDLIAITDHNSFAGLTHFQECCKKYNQKAIAGIEMTTKYRSVEPHILGYFPLDITRQDVEEIIAINRSLMKKRDDQLEAMLNKLIEDYPNLSIEEFYEYAASIKSNKNYNRVHLVQYLIHKGLCDSIHDGFARLAGDETKYYVEKQNITCNEAIDAIHYCGGKAIVAHPGEYHLDVPLSKFIEDMENAGIDGFEIFHPHNDEEFIKEFLQYTHCPTLYTCGSDYHGKNKINELGIPYFYDMSQSELKDFYDMTQENAYNCLYKGE